MILSTESAPDDEGRSGVPAPVPAPDVETVAGGGRNDAGEPRGLRARLLDYGAHAAMIVGLIGFAWTVGDHVVHRPALPGAPALAAATDVSSTKPASDKTLADNSPSASASPGRTAAADVSAPAAKDPLAELRERNRALAATVEAMQARLDVLQASVGENARVAAQVRGLETGLDGLKAGLGTARTEQVAAVARLDGKIDKLAHEPGSRIQQLVDRLGKLEHASVDVAPTASLPRPAGHEGASADARPVSAARPSPRPADGKIDGRVADKGTEGKTAVSKAAPEEPATQQPVLTSWVVRDVYRGVALIEGRRGTLEVVPGVGIPGAGIVKSIDRHGNGWTVTTTKGLVAFAAPAARDYRRADRGSYGYGASAYGYDF